MECDFYAKLHDSDELDHLRADSLMYYHIYGDLYMLSKSSDLGLSVLSMNQHYLELFTYLSEVENIQELCLTQTIMFFVLRNVFIDVILR